MTIKSFEQTEQNTAEFHSRAWQRLADEEKLPFDSQANEALRGVDRRESLLLIVGDSPGERLHQRHYLEAALQLLDELRRSGIKTAIGSASKNARTVIEKLGIADRIDAIADGDSVARPKPAPDVFLSAANQLGLDPAHCVVLEDAPAGIAAGVAAEMWTIGIGAAVSVESANVVLPNLIGVHLNDLQAQLGKYSAT